MMIPNFRGTVLLHCQTTTTTMMMMMTTTTNELYGPFSRERSTPAVTLGLAIAPLMKLCVGLNYFYSSTPTGYQLELFPMDPTMMRRHLVCTLIYQS
jgi:hypothetical protein